VNIAGLEAVVNAAGWKVDRAFGVPNEEGL